MADGAPSRGPGRSGELLYVVIPVYNEEASIGRVLREWADALNSLQVQYRLLVLDDGSRDGTFQALSAFARAMPNLELIRKPNSGHGQTCIEGYRQAIARGASWVFQIDGDGQCDPRYFAELWQRRLQCDAVFGKRVTREDGAGRRVVSWFCERATRLVSGVSVRDPNVPYRLIRAEVLAAAIKRFPSEFWLANILVAVVVQRGLGEGTGFVEINFRDRHAGEASVKWATFLRHGVRLCRALRGSRDYAAKRAAAVAASSGLCCLEHHN